MNPDGFISSVTPLGNAYDINASTVLEGSSPSGNVTVRQNMVDGPITITRSWLFDNSTCGGAHVTDILSPGATSILWNVTVAGTSALPWSVGIDTQLTFSPAAYNSLKLWSAWDRGSIAGFPGSWVDPLQPSDLLPSGWWDGMYRLGRLTEGVDEGSYVACAASDLITVPLASVISADPTASDVGFTVLLSPEDPPFDTCLSIQGSLRSFTFHRYHHRIWAAGPPVELHMEVAGHAADWRGGLGAAVAAFPDHFEPVNAEVCRGEQ